MTGFQELSGHNPDNVNCASLKRLDDYAVQNQLPPWSIRMVSLVSDTKNLSAKHSLSKSQCDVHVAYAASDSLDLD